MSTLVFLLEEISAKIMLEQIVKEIVPENIDIKYITFSGKSDLEKQLIDKMRYWQVPESRFIVMRDQDLQDCHEIKQELLDKIKQTGKEDVCLVRIACHELENFFLGDLDAVETGLNIPHIAKLKKKSKYRNADNIQFAAKELQKLTSGKYSKCIGASKISPRLKLDGSNRSHSFGMLLEAISRQVNLLRQQQN